MNNSKEVKVSNKRTVLTAEKIAADIMHKNAVIGFSASKHISALVCIILSVILMFLVHDSGIRAVILVIPALLIAFIYIVGELEIRDKRKKYTEDVLSGKYRIISCRIQQKGKNSDPDDIEEYYIKFQWDNKRTVRRIDEKTYNEIEENEKIYIVVFDDVGTAEVVNVYRDCQWVLHSEVRKKLE